MHDAPSAPLVRNPHPFYGPCDAMGPNDGCWVCFEMRATDAELAAYKAELEAVRAAEAEYARRAAL